MNNIVMNEELNGVKLTGIVAVYNEATKLRRCLSSLKFCDQIIVVDMNSTDTSPVIAREFTQHIIQHERVDIVEIIRKWVLQFAENDWVVLIDPDEVVPACLAERLIEIARNESSAGLVRAPWQFYFAGKQLTTTVWGRTDSRKPVLIHKDRVQVEPYVHRGYRLLPGYIEISIPRTSGNAIEHYWVDNYRQWFEKHKKYLSYEGESRYAGGQRFSWTRLAMHTIRDLKLDMWDYHGIAGGWTGITLSILHAWYTMMSWLSLREHEKRITIK